MTIKTIIGDATVTTCQVKDRLHLIIGDDAETDRLRKKLLAGGHTLIDGATGSRIWRTWDEVHPTIWHADGNRCLHHLVEHHRTSDGEHIRTKIKETWRKA